jgi:cytochrome c-type biogenesis protein CcmH/NrfG
MNSFTNAETFRLSIIGLSVAVTLVGLSLGAICAYIWTRMPEKQDPLRRSRVETRLSQLADTPHAQSGKSI